MDYKDIRIAYTTCKKEELSIEEQELVQRALDARMRAYAPYSSFYVGAALLLENNQIVDGNNQENASYPAGVCAERVALLYARAQFPETAVSAIAICGGKDKKLSTMPLAPCGICRQTILETENTFKKPIKIYLVGEEQIYIFDSIERLLPLSFKSEHLS